MNLQENIHRIKQVMGLLNEEVLNYTGNKRIILIGPPTVGKSTIATELSRQLRIEYIILDKLQQDYGYGDGKELELVRNVLSNNFEKYNTPSILDFGGGHVYNEGVHELLSDYPNVFLLMPSKDPEKSNELLRRGNEQRWTGFMDQIIQGLKSGNHKHTKEKEIELISKLERMKQGEGGKYDKEDLPDTPEMQGWGGLDMGNEWNKFVPLSSSEHDINRTVAKHIIAVYDESGNRKDKVEIANEIISNLTKDNIHEIVTTKKEKIGSGKDHVVYDYKADPTKIIKSAWGVDKGQYKYGAESNRHLVDMNSDHIEIFLKYPNLFPKVYRHNNRYAIIEKLDTSKVFQDQKDLYNQLIQYDDVFKNVVENDFISGLYYTVTKVSGFLPKVVRKMRKAGEDLTLLEKYVTLFKKVKNTVGRSSYYGLDVTAYNLGYDNEGNLKLLDF